MSLQLEQVVHTAINTCAAVGSPIAPELCNLLLQRAINVDYLSRALEQGTAEMLRITTVYAARLAKGECFADDPTATSTARNLHDDAIRLKEAARGFGPMFTAVTGTTFTDAMRKHAGVAL